VLSKFARRQELLGAKIALETGLLATMEFGAVVKKPKLGAHVLDGSAFETDVELHLITISGNKVKF
jgi:hypothetical protein